MIYRLLWAAAALGVALHVAGLTWDVYLHTEDPTLAAREGVFTLSNPGHALIIVGLALTAAAVLAVLVTWLHEARVGGPGRAAAIARLGVLPLMGLAVGASIFVATRAQGDSHDHHLLQNAGTHAHDAVVAPETAPAAADTGGAAPAHGHTSASAATPQVSNDPMGEDAAHTHGVEVPVSPEQLAAAAAFYAGVQSAAARFEDIREALAGGYFQITQDLPAIAAHFINSAHNADGVLMDVDRPEILLYSKRLDGTWRLVGFMFSSERVSETPPSFFGPLDVWHRHENLCFTPNEVSVRPGKALCGGIFVPRTAWNLHVWTMPGASGVFAHDFAPISPGAFPGATRSAAQDLAAKIP
ncbi:MAG: hypothetical protein ACR2NO_02330 [Chloroflexota bacterium]